MREPAEIDSDDDGPVIARAAAIDVAKATGMVCARVPHAGKPDRKVTKVWEVDATTAAIIELAGHLTGLGIERVVLEATGDYWRCWHYLLSAAELECWLVNARDVKNVPGRPKSDPLTELRREVPPVRDGWESVWLRSLTMIIGGDAPRDLSWLAVPLRGSLEATGELFEPYRLVDAGGVVVVPASVYFRELAACGRPAATHRSYGMAMLRWWRFIWAVECPWGEATRVEARDFCSWIQLAGKPVRPHWRYPEGGAPGTVTARTAAGVPNPVTGKPSAGRGYATATVVHCESVLRRFL